MVTWTGTMLMFSVTTLTFHWTGKEHLQPMFYFNAYVTIILSPSKNYLVLVVFTMYVYCVYPIQQLHNVIMNRKQN